MTFLVSLLDDRSDACRVMYCHIHGIEKLNTNSSCVVLNLPWVMFGFLKLVQIQVGISRHDKWFNLLLLVLLLMIHKCIAYWCNLVKHWPVPTSVTPMDYRLAGQGRAWAATIDDCAQARAQATTNN